MTSLQLAAQKLSDIKLDWILLDGPAVQMARNQLAAYAIEKNFHELIFWDKDVVAQTDGQNTTVSAIMRLISHDVDMVCGIYGTRSMDTHIGTFNRCLESNRAWMVCKGQALLHWLLQDQDFRL